MLIMGSRKFQRDTFDKKSKPENNPRESGYTLMTGPDEYFNDNILGKFFTKDFEL